MTTARKQITAAIYVRISHDRTGERAGVERQREDCRKHCKRLGWKVGPIFEDNSISAHNGKLRPAYQALLEALESGSVGAVVTWHPDRLHRRLSELLPFIEVVEKAGAEVATVQGGAYDLTTSSGRMTAKIVGAVSEAESEHKGERQRRANLGRAQEGRLRRDGTRPFGLTKEGEIVEAEAEALNEVAAKILAGHSMRSIARDLNTAGMRTTKGNHWTSAVLGRTFRTPYVVGQVVYHGEVVGPGQWGPIVDEITWKRACAVLSAPERNTATTNARKHLLPGFLFCGRCGSRLFSAVVNGKHSYSCKLDAERTGCGRLTVVGQPVEELVRDSVIELVSGTRKVSAALASTENDAYANASAEIAELAAKRSRLEEMRLDGSIDRQSFNRRATELDAAVTAAEKRQDAALGVVTMVGVETEPEALRAQWDASGLDWRRSLIAAWIERITILPAPHKGARFKRDRVDILWRGAQDASAAS